MVKFFNETSTFLRGSDRCLENETCWKVDVLLKNIGIFI